MGAKPKYYYVWRCAVTGKFVKKAYADKYPAKTVRVRRLRKP